MVSVNSFGWNGIEEHGAPGVIRTRDPLLRRQTLYPTELRALYLPNFSQIEVLMLELRPSVFGAIF
jgi:hypothetical protein